MSRKDYTLAAEEIRNLNNVDERKRIARVMILIFEKDNTRFDAEIFWDACGLSEYLLER